MGIEFLLDENLQAWNPYSHGLSMPLICSMVITSIIFVLTRSRQTSLLFGSVVFSHWIIDGISHPITATFPDNKKLPIFFNGDYTVGLGAWRSQLGMILGEYVLTGILILSYLQFIISGKSLSSPLSFMKNTEVVQ